MSNVQFGTWAVDESPVFVEYSMVLIEEIRHLVAEGYQKLARGGVEVGGLLYGTHEGKLVRILAVRPIPCEHARGPGFLLSDNDRRGLVDLMAGAAQDPGLEGFTCLGWFLSHTKGEISLTESDLQIYDEYFSAPWQLTMVVRPSRGGGMRAGFFVREPNGAVNSDQSYQEFDFPDRLAGVLDQTPRVSPERRSPAERRRPPRQDSPASDFPTGSVFSEASSQPLIPAQPANSRLPWYIAWAALLTAIGVIAYPYLFGAGASQSVSLQLLERDGVLQIEWDKKSPLLGGAEGSLVITDAKEDRTVALTSADLAEGRYAYERKSGDIGVRLTVRAMDGTSVQEASRFLGQPPVRIQPEEIRAQEERRATLEAEIKRLQAENGTQAQRIQQLERTLRILQNSLGVK